MSVSRTVFQIFTVKECRELTTGIRGRSRSLKMVPFDRPYTTFYSSAIVNIALSCTVFTARRVRTARTMPQRDVCLSVCLSVRPSHASILSKRLNISSKFFRHRVAQQSSFPYQIGWQCSDWNPLPNGGVECKGL